MPAVRFDCTVTTFSIQIPIKKLFIKIARLPLQATLLSMPAERYNTIDNLFFRKARVYKPVYNLFTSMTTAGDSLIFGGH